jgi:prepilin-type N-terminal cleavage/methylation domain-containing protein
MSRRGFTLLEVMVALVIAGTVVLVAERVFATAVDTSRAVTVGRRSLDREINSGRLLGAVFGSIEVGPSAAQFEGHPSTVRFATWVQGVDGWFERHTVTLRLDQTRFVMRAEGLPPVALAEGVAGLEFDYLMAPGAETRWVREWVSPVSAPLAVRVRLAGSPRSNASADTAIYLIKARG